MKFNSAAFPSSTYSSSLSLSSSSAATLSLSPSSVSSTTSSSSFTMRHLILSVTILLLYTSSLSQACFIRNCPKGGKRALDSVSVGQRPCLSCGPGNTGQCIGPNICCTPHFGCHMGTPHAEVCEKENDSTTPCYVEGEVCGPHDSGKCVSEGICCDSETCTMVDHCKVQEFEKRDQEKVLRLLERLLKTKSKK